MNRIGFGKFFGELFRLANPSPRQPEGLFVVQTALLESDNSIAQMRFQFASVVRREVRLRGQFLTPVFNGGVQIETGLIFHNRLNVL